MTLAWTPEIRQLLCMTDLELQQLRKERWRLDGKPIQTIEDARAFWKTSDSA